MGISFNVPTWARKAGCQIANEPLGGDYEAAVARAENVLLPAFDAWRMGGAEGCPAIRRGPWYARLGFRRVSRRPTLHKARRQDKAEPRGGLPTRGRYTLKDGRRFGSMRAAIITTAVTDDLYVKLLTITETDANGNTVQRERRTSVNHAMKTCRRAWNIAARRNPGKLPLVNPFAQMGLTSSDRKTPTATFVELTAFRAKAVELGFASLATAALIGWEWLQREEDIFDTFTVAHYRPKERPNAVRVLHEKTREENWVPLFDEAGAPLYPELMAELDALKVDRVGAHAAAPRRAPMANWRGQQASRRPRHAPAQGQGDHPRRRLTRRAFVHFVPAWRLHRGGRRRSERRRDQGAGAAQIF